MKRIRFLLMFLACFLCPASAGAADFYKVLGMETVYLAPGSGVTRFSSVPGQAVEALVELEGGDIRYTYDGTAPTSTTGYIMRNEGKIRFFTPYQINNFQWTHDEGTSSGVTVRGTYEGRQ